MEIMKLIHSNDSDECQLGQRGRLVKEEPNDCHWHRGIDTHFKANRKPTRMWECGLQNNGEIWNGLPRRNPREIGENLLEGGQFDGVVSGFFSPPPVIRGWPAQARNTFPPSSTIIDALSGTPVSGHRRTVSLHSPAASSRDSVHTDIQGPAVVPEAVPRFVAGAGESETSFARVPKAIEKLKDWSLHPPAWGKILCRGEWV
ncbi:hypothetical protein BD779DRAFT_1473381 [Infundibulicybe gibba]|nr:hypothetical protein BD779DRAFT_1473381 [Infundibulicybe gibba]